MKHRQTMAQWVIENYYWEQQTSIVLYYQLQGDEGTLEQWQTLMQEQLMPLLVNEPARLAHIFNDYDTAYKFIHQLFVTLKSA